MKIAVLLFILIVILNIGCTETPHHKTLYIIGDSTVKNGKGDGAKGLWGWGDFINQYFDTTQIAIQNDALGGTSSRTFRRKGMWYSVLDSLRAGDYVMIQFGHNDSGNINDTLRARGTLKGIGEETEEIDNLITGEFEIVHTYGWYLRKYVHEIKSKEAIPIIISPIPRNKWENGKVMRNNNDYGMWAKQVAESEGVTFIDLNEKMALAMDQVGEQNMFGTYFYKRDHTHTTSKGALLNASLIAQNIKADHKCKLSKYVVAKPIAKLPAKRKVFIIGDSTVEEKGEKSTGWGKMLPQYLDTIRLEIHNCASGGHSSRTFRSEGLWRKVEEHIKSGDFVMIQFGHNDGGEIDKGKRRGSLKGDGDQSEMSISPTGEREVVHTYGWYIRKYITESKAKGATPIVFSQVPRNEWVNGKVERVNEDYGKWAEEAATRENTLFLDLNDAVALKYEAMGKDLVKTYFPNDHTHTNEAGANINAQTVAELIITNKGCKLAEFIEITEKESFVVR